MYHAALSYRLNPMPAYPCVMRPRVQLSVALDRRLGIYEPMEIGSWEIWIDGELVAQNPSRRIVSPVPLADETLIVPRPLSTGAHSFTVEAEVLLGNGGFGAAVATTHTWKIKSSCILNVVDRPAEEFVRIITDENARRHIEEQFRIGGGGNVEIGLYIGALKFPFAGRLEVRRSGDEAYKFVREVVFGNSIYAISEPLHPLLESEGFATPGQTTSAADADRIDIRIVPDVLVALENGFRENYGHAVERKGISMPTDDAILEPDYAYGP